MLPSDPTADFSQVSLHNMAGEDVWPIVAVSYVYVRADLSKMGEKACLLKAFLQFIISDEGQSLLPRYGFVAIPDKVKAVAQVLSSKKTNFNPALNVYLNEQPTSVASPTTAAQNVRTHTRARTTTRRPFTGW